MRIIYLFIFANLSIFTFGQSKAPRLDKQPKYKKQNVIVKFIDDIDPKKLKNEQDLFLKEKSLLELHNKLNVSSYTHVINQFFLIEYQNKKYSVKDVLNLYEKSKFVEYTQPNYIGRSRKTKTIRTKVPNDEYYNYQWYLHNDGTYPIAPADAAWDYHNSKVKEGADINMEKAWAIEKGNDKLIIAIVDGGVYLDHPEFEGRIWKNPKEIPNNGIDDDDNGYIDDVNGWDFIDSDNSPNDITGHGTTCAGICAATNNNDIGYAGINSFAKIMSVRVDGDSYSSATLVAGLKYAADNGANVINLSLGQYTGGQMIKEGVGYAYNKGCIMVAATANDGTRIGGEETSCEGNENRHDFPGCFAEVITVGGTIYDDSRMVWRDPSYPNAPNEGSAYGNHLDVVAPGYSIISLGFTPDELYPGYAQFGCSFATPQVTGVVSLILSMNPKLTFEQVRDIIRKSADDEVGRKDEDKKGRDMYMGYGRLNAYNALLETKKTLVKGKDFDGDGVLDENDECREVPGLKEFSGCPDTDRDGIKDSKDACPKIVGSKEFNGCPDDKILEDNKEMKIFPNPFEKNITVKTDKKIKYLTVYSILGQEVLKINIVNNVNKINLSKLSSGLYFLKVSLEDGSAFVKKIIHK